MKIILLIVLTFSFIACGQKQSSKKLSDPKHPQWETIFKRGPAFREQIAFNDKVSDCTGVVSTPTLSKDGQWIYPVVKMACPYREAPYHLLDEVSLKNMVVSNRTK